ncbi:hypothetical protein SARC_01071 [Sphaeroforma arctica JP610]|uniref:Anaphase-promoting complex subunit 4 WD40 domain-containing protein n=1 Tax=Sphaeroforma arctica JP610 TaxID=667725 RepID=A0A0L0GD24_9EUKA|nr:hypothetical protein SARC_01071 [Sphaeroforma arctica JP610]KNC86809.1 hypothetical protein SARC_01071 [Sphaeroforma arctica JP610]|eukprot:XP_014160711.1 hypothetical protein SARC_01071 [Sphaeroforma arctica JP610]
MSVHRCKFVEYVPQPIHCLAFNSDSSLLAVSRADGNIEIWHVADWVMERCILGGENVSVEAIAWAGTRLFSAGLDGYIVEWDLATLTSKQAIDTAGGAVWCLQANKKGEMLAAGCEDGRVRLFDIANNCLLFEKGFDKVEGRILALAWHTDGQVIVSGTSNSVIHKWSVASGRSTLHITIADFLKESTIVWAIAVLADFTIISGDSLGNTQFWDGAFGTLTQTFKSHEADVLALSVSSCQKTVYASGVDNKVAQYKLARNANGLGQAKWVFAKKMRVHTHDVRALALSTNDATLVSGGVDTQLVVYNTSKFENSAPRRIPPFPHSPIIHIARKSDMLLCRLSNHVELWRLGSGDAEAVTRNPAMVAQLSLKGDGNLMCSNISASGEYIALSDVDSTKVFHLQYHDDSTGRRCKITKSDTNALSEVYSHRLLFTPFNSQLVSAGSDGVVRVLNLETGVVETEFDGHKGTGPITHLEVSSSGQYLAVGDANKNITIYDLQAGAVHYTLNKFDSTLTAMSFRPKTDDLVLVLSCNRIHVIDTKQKRISDWTRDNVSKFPGAYLKKYANTVGIIHDPTRENYVFSYDSGMLARLDITQPMSDNLVSIDSGRRGRKNSESNTGNTQASKTRTVTPQLYTTDMYKPMLFADFTRAGDLVVAERPWSSILADLPSQLVRNKYGQ